MKISRPSPAMVVAVIALITAMSGTAVAAVGYASNAGAVDGHSVVGADSSLRRARGNVVATARGGGDAGRIPGKFVAGVSRASSFAKTFEVRDNAAGTAAELVDEADTGGLGGLSTLCNDQSARPAVENPTTTISFNNRSGGFVNVARRVGLGASRVAALANGATESFGIAGQEEFTISVEQQGVALLINGAVRQDGLNSAGASCLVFGTVQLVR